MKRLILILCLIGAAFSGSHYASAMAQDKKLDALNDEIENRKARQAELQAEADRLKSQQKRLRQRVIVLAKDLQNIDAERDRLEERLSELAVTENRFDEALQQDRAALSRLLAGLQAMQKQPAPAFAVHADDALAAVQGAVVMAAVVPGMQARADELRDRLTELAALRRRMDRQSEALIIAERDAATARADLDQALAAKTTAETKARQAAEREAAEIRKLVREARDLRDLARRLANRKTANIPAPTGDGFARARGLVPMPVAGQVVGRFGEANENGVVRQGLDITARAGAQITAPYDGVVMYSGPFRQYGEIVILSLTDGFQMILAGMADSGAYVGQELLAGEPIGRLGSFDHEGHQQEGAHGQEKHRFGTSSSGRSQLYMELRFDGRPIDPMPWLKDIG